MFLRPLRMDEEDSKNKRKVVTATRFVDDAVRMKLELLSLFFLIFSSSFPLSVLPHLPPCRAASTVPVHILEVVCLHVVTDHGGSHGCGHFVPGFGDEKLNRTLAREDATHARHAQQHSHHRRCLVLAQRRKMESAHNREHSHGAQHGAQKVRGGHGEAGVVLDGVLDAAHTLICRNVVAIYVADNAVVPRHGQHLLRHSARQHVQRVDAVHNILESAHCREGGKRCVTEELK